MANAPIDENGTPGWIAALNTDGTTVVAVKVNAATHALKVLDDTTGSDNGPVNGLKDENNVTSLIATSSVDGFTPVVVYADSSGNLLVDSM